MKGEKEWILTEGLKLIYDRARSCWEVLQTRESLNRVVFASIFQHGLKAGHDYGVEGTPFLKILNFSDTAEAEAEEMFCAYNVGVPPIVLHLPTTLGISVEGIKALAQVVDPSSPYP